MLNDLAMLIIYTGIIALALAPVCVIVWIIVECIPDEQLDRWRTGKPARAPSYYTPRKIKVDKRVYRKGRDTHPA